MKLDNCYYFEYLDYWPHLYCILMMFRLICPSAFFRCFMSNSEAHTEPQTEPFIGSMRVNCYNSVNRLQVLSYSKYSLLFLPVVGIEFATPDDYIQKHFPTKHLMYRHHVSLPDNSEEIFVTYESNVSINSWDTPLSYQMFFTLVHIAFFFFMPGKA